MSHWRIHSSLLLRPRNLIRVSAKNCGLLWGFCYPLSRLRHLVLFFSFSIPQKRNVNLLLLFCILTWSIEVGGKKEGNVLLICAAWGGGTDVFRFHMGVEYKFIIYCQWGMSSATQKKATIWGHVALVLKTTCDWNRKIEIDHLCQ